MFSRSKIEYWIHEEELLNVSTSEYWNNEEEEKKKEWYVVDTDNNSAIQYIRDKGLETSFNNAISHLQKMGIEPQGTFLDIAAGVGYTSAIFSRFEKVIKGYCLDISRHRIEKIAPVIFKQYGANDEKIVRVVGSFYDLKLPANSIDFVIMAQAFHHALEPERLLEEVSRVLKRGGKVIVTGEQVISRLDHFIRVLRKMVGDVLSLTGLRNCENNNRQLFKFGFRDVFPSNLEKGDTHYSLKQVTHIFNQAGFSIKCYSFKHNYQKGREWYYLATKN